MFNFDINSMDEWGEFCPPSSCHISAGGSGGGSTAKNKSRSESGTHWNPLFMDELQRNGPSVTYSNEQDGVRVTGDTEGGQQAFAIGVPKFQGLEDMDYQKLEKGLYDRQMQNTNPAFQKVKAQTREELSQANLLNSPAQYSEGGAMDNLTDSYLAENQKAATDASNKTIQLKQQELARKTGFDVDMVKLFQTIMQQYADTALKAGQYGDAASSGSSSSWNHSGQFTFGGMGGGTGA